MTISEWLWFQHVELYSISLRIPPHLLNAKRANYFEGQIVVAKGSIKPGTILDWRYEASQNPFKGVRVSPLRGHNEVDNRMQSKKIQSFAN